MEMKRYNQMGGREEVEWATIWYDKADSVMDHKVLMIGESTARQIRGELSRMMGKPVDLFGSSSSLRDVLFWRQLDCFLKDSIYRYDVVIIWMGHHARTDITGKAPLSEQDYEDFREDFILLLDRVREVCSRIFVLSNFDIIIPATKEDKKQRKIRKFLHMPLPEYKRNEAESVIIDRKNEIIREVTLSQGLQYVDIHGIMKQTSFERTDHVHYERKSDTYQVEVLLKAMH